MPFPNKATQFKPGESGNPDGKPKGTKHLQTYIQELMNDEDFEAILTTPKGQIEFKGAPAIAIIKTAMHRALYDKDKGSQYMDWLAKHGWKQQLDITTNDKDLPTPIYNGESVKEFTEFLKNKSVE